jgi:hypothetical protein
MKLRNLYLVFLFINSCSGFIHNTPMKTISNKNNYLSLNYNKNRINKYEAKKDLIIKTSNLHTIVYFIDGLNSGIFISFITGIYDIRNLPLFIILSVIIKVVLLKYI